VAARDEGGSAAAKERVEHLAGAVLVMAAIRPGERLRVVTDEALTALDLLPMP
jgi:hypothetical protein